MTALRLRIPALVVAAGVWLLTTSSLAVAQSAPAQPVPANPDAEKRMKALEEKMDRVLSWLEARERESRPPTESAVALQALTLARDKILVIIEARQNQFAQFRKSIPSAFSPIVGRQDSANIFAERLKLIEVSRAELQSKKAKTERQLQEIRRVFEEKGRDAVMDLIHAIGLKVTAFGNTGELEKYLLSLRIQREIVAVSHGPGHPKVVELDKAIEMAKNLYSQMKPAPDQPKDQNADMVEALLKAMEAEVKDSTALLQMFEGMYETEKKALRVFQEFETHDAAFRQEINLLRDMLATLEKMIKDVQGLAPSK